ncbi:MAG: hypothetical protein ACRERV_08800 [Methylococcales bacterium]
MEKVVITPRDLNFPGFSGVTGPLKVTRQEIHYVMQRLAGNSGEALLASGNLAVRDNFHCDR